MAAGGAARLTTGVCALLQVAILVRVLGAEGYGLWIALLALAGFITLFDAGVGVTIETALAEAHAQTDDRRLRQVCGSGLLTLAAIGGLYLVAGALALPWINWSSLLSLAPEHERTARLGACLVYGLAAIGVPLNLAPRLAGALQVGRLNAAWTAIGSVAALVVAVVAAKLGWHWFTLVTALSLIPLFQNAGLLLSLFRRLGWPVAWFETLPGAEWKARLRRGLMLALPQLGQGLLQVAPPLTIAAVGGPVAVTAFSLIQRLAAPLTQGQGLILTPLWPTYVEAHARGDFVWLRRMLRLSVTATFTACAMLALLVLGREWILAWWVGPAVEVPPPAFAWLAGLWFALNLCAQPLYHFLVGVGRWRAVGLSSLAGHGFAFIALVIAARADASPATQLALASIGLAAIWIPGLAWAVWNVNRSTLSA
ncbi:MAG TPA: oligosaccharide flippase family protein [Opitutaceae bacterium]